MYQTDGVYHRGSTSMCIHSTGNAVVIMSGFSLLQLVTRDIMQSMLFVCPPVRFYVRLYKLSPVIEAYLSSIHRRITFLVY